MQVLSLPPTVIAPVAIAIGAVLGAFSRYFLTVRVTQRLRPGFPYGTLVVNLSGALLMGFCATLALKQVITPAVQSLLTTGFLGSYTTFSTYALDTSNLWRTRGWAMALVYWAGSAIGGGLSLELGITLARGVG